MGRPLHAAQKVSGLFPPAIAGSRGWGQGSTNGKRINKFWRTVIRLFAFSFVDGTYQAHPSLPPRTSRLRTRLLRPGLHDRGKGGTIQGSSRRPAALPGPGHGPARGGREPENKGSPEPVPCQGRALSFCPVLPRKKLWSNRDRREGITPSGAPAIAYIRISPSRN